MYTLFDGRYEVLRVLGKGGMGEVYLARHVMLGTLWAIKKMVKTPNSDIDLLAEPNILKKLNHPALPRIIDILDEWDAVYIIEDYIEGVSLDVALERIGHYPENTVVTWAKQLCDVLSYLHAHRPNPIIYRDMKPGNLIIDTQNNIKLVDFGIAREYKADSANDTQYIGTRGYAAPEQYGYAQSDARTDIYSLGVTLYSMLTGKSPNDPPYAIVPVRQLNDKLSRGIEYIIEKCTRQDPSLRYQTADLLLMDLINIKKYNVGYKRKLIIKELKIMFLLLLLISSSLSIYLGFQQLDKEEVLRYKSYITSAEVSISEQDYETANDFAEKAHRLIPEDIDSYRIKALSLLKSGETEECVSFIANDVFNYRPEGKVDPQIQYIFGTALFELDNYVASFQAFHTALSYDENNEMYWRDYAVALARANHLDEAIVALDKIKKKQMAVDISYYVSGEIKVMQEKIIEAEADFLECIQTTKNTDLKRRAYLAIGDLYRHDGSEMPGGYTAGMKRMEDALTQLGNRDDIVLIEILGELENNQADIEADDNIKARLYQSAISRFEKMISLGVRRSYVYRNIVIICQKMGNFEKALKSLETMEKLDSKDFRVYMLYALVYADIEGKKDNLIRDYAITMTNYEKAVKLAPQGEANLEMAPLVSLVRELKDKGWNE